MVHGKWGKWRVESGEGLDSKSKKCDLGQGLGKGTIEKGNEMAMEMEMEMGVGKDRGIKDQASRGGYVA